MELKIAQKLVLAALAFSGAAFAQTKAPEPDYTLAFNAGLVTDYRYRGISQSRLKPAVQAGIDWTHKSGFYLGTWGSSIKWIKDAGGDAPIEMDFYGGYRFEFSGIAFDAGLLRYQYFNHDLAVSPNTTEAYIAATASVLTVKYSHSLTDTFGFANSKNSYYLDASMLFDLGNGWSVVPHAGYQKIKNFKPGSYSDYSLALNKDFGNGFIGSATIVGTDSDSGVYFTPSGKHTGKTGLVLGVKYNF